MQLCCHQRVLGTHCSALTKAVQSSVLLVVWADNQGFRRQHHQGTSWALKFRSQDSKLKSIWETGLKRCFSLFGLCLNDPRLRGLGLPRSQARGVDAWYPWGFIPILKSLAAKIASRGEIIGTSSPYWDEMMMTNVKQFQIPRFPNDKRFQTKTLCRSCELSFKVVGYSERWLWGMVCWSPLFRCHCPMMIKRWSQRDSFLIKKKHPSIWGHL